MPFPAEKHAILAFPLQTFIDAKHFKHRLLLKEDALLSFSFPLCQCQLSVIRLVKDWSSSKLSWPPYYFSVGCLPESNWSRMMFAWSAMAWLYLDVFKAFITLLPNAALPHVDSRNLCHPPWGPVRQAHKFGKAGQLSSSGSLPCSQLSLSH